MLMFNKWRWKLPGILPAVLLLALVAYISGHRESITVSSASLGMLLVLCFTAYPLSRWIFTDTLEGVIFAFPIGFLLHSLALAIVGMAFGIKIIPFLVYLCTVLGVFLAVETRRSLLRNLATEIRPLGKADLALVFTWIGVLLLVVYLPYFHVGIDTPQGIAYRAYFNADFFRNMGVTGSLNTSGIPPTNPYFAGELLRYHWFFQVFPAYWQTLFPGFRLDFALVQFSLVVVILFAASMALVLRRFLVTKRAVLLSIPVLILGASYDGILALQHIRERKLTLQFFQELNIDGLSRWTWQTPQVDTLLRTMLYGPQHLITLTLILLVFCGWSFQLPRKARFLIYALLFCGVAFSTFLAALAIAMLGLFLAWHAFRKDRAYWIDVAVYLAGGLLFLALYMKMQLFAADAGHLTFGANPTIFQHMPWYYFVEWGALGILGIAGIFWNTGKMPVRILASACAASLFVIFFLALDLTDKSVFSIKFGYIVHLALFLLTAAFLDRILISRRPVAGMLLVALLVAPAAIGTVMDVSNSQDITNEKFTTFIDKDHQQILAWIRQNIPYNAVIQNDVLEEEGYVSRYVSEIPPFGKRSVYLSDPILSTLFQIPQEDYVKRTEEMCSMFQSDKPQAIHKIATDTGIQYIYLENIDVSSFHTHLEEPYFTRLKEHGRMAVFRINTGVKVDAPADVPKETVGKDTKILLRKDQEVVLHARLGGNFFGPEPHGICETAQWMSNDGQLILTATTPLKGTLSLSAIALGKVRTMVIYSDNQEIHREKISARGGRIDFAVDLKEGRTRLRIVSLEGAEIASVYGGNDRRSLSFKIYRLGFEPSS